LGDEPFNKPDASIEGRLNSAHATTNANTNGTPEPLVRFWEVVKRMPRYLRFSFELLRDDRVPAPAKAALTVGGVYAVSPIDAIPGFIPVAGQLDDLLVLLFAIRQALAFCPDELADEYLTRFNLAEPGIDADIKTTLTATRWVAITTLQAVGRFSVREGKRLFRLSQRAVVALENRWHATNRTNESDST
jgi:uncharacterized membrane protein YkvA (DUF1232 family)